MYFYVQGTTNDEVLLTNVYLSHNMQIVDLVRAYNKEVKWREQGHVPATVEEHLQVSARSGACHLLSCTSFVGMGDVAAQEAFEWVCSVPKIVQALCIILRLSDDLKSYEVIIFLVLHPIYMSSLFQTLSYNRNGFTLYCITKQLHIYVCSERK
jgi:hypothetical protein